MRLHIHSENKQNFVKEKTASFTKDVVNTHLPTKPHKKKKNVFIKYPHLLAKDKNFFQISSPIESNKLSLTECRKILCSDGLNYTEQEISLIRDWLYHLADITIDAFEKIK